MDSIEVRTSFSQKGMPVEACLLSNRLLLFGGVEDEDGGDWIEGLAG